MNFRSKLAICKSEIARSKSSICRAMIFIIILAIGLLGNSSSSFALSEFENLNSEVTNLYNAGRYEKQYHWHNARWQ